MGDLNGINDLAAKLADDILCTDGCAGCGSYDFLFGLGVVTSGLAQDLNGTVTEVVRHRNDIFILGTADKSDNAVSDSGVNLNIILCTGSCVLGEAQI